MARPLRPRSSSVPSAPRLSPVRLTRLEDGTVEDLRATDYHDGVRFAQLDVSGVDLADVRVVDCRIGTLDVSRATLSDVDLRGVEFSAVKGVESLSGTLIGEHQLAEFGPLFAAAIGVRIE